MLAVFELFLGEEQSGVGNRGVGLNLVENVLVVVGCCLLL